MACFNCSESPAVAGCPFGRDAAPSAVGITMPSWRHNQIDLSRSRPPPSLPQTEAASSPDRVGAASQETRRTRPGGGRRVRGPDQVGVLDEVDAGRWGGGATTEEEEVDPRRQQWIHEGRGVRGVPR